MNRILVAGGSGHLGRETIAELKRRGRWVRILTRRPEQLTLDVDDIARGDLLDLSSLQKACKGIDCVFSVAGASVDLGLAWRSPGFRAVDYTGNINLLTAAQTTAVKKFVYVSVFNTPAYADLAYVRAHTDVAHALRQADLAYAVIEPTGFFSAFAVFPRLVRYGVAPLIGTGEAKTNPIHEKDLARICADAIETGDGEIPIGGPEVLSRRAIFELAFNAVGKKPRFVHLPNGLVSFNQWTISRIDPRLGDLVAFFKVVSQTDVVAPAQGHLRLEDYFRALVAHSRSRIDHQT